MTRRELFAIIYFERVKFSYYLLNQEFTLCTDHSSLRWLDSFHDKATDVLAQWLHYLEPFRQYMTILYRPGKLHSNADALSRIDTRLCPCDDYPDQGHLIKKDKSPSEKKPRLLHTIQTRGSDGDSDLDTDLVSSLSDEDIRVLQKLDPELCWFMELLYKHAVKPNVKSLREELSGSPFGRVTFDVIGPLPITVKHNRFIITMIDYFSKWAEAFALPNHKAETVADSIIKWWIAHHGIPVRIHSDNTLAFRGYVVTQVKKMLSMKGTFTTLYRPQSNCLCDRMNQTIENIIKCTVREEGTTWDKSLDLVMKAYRATPQTSTGLTPNMLVTGKEMNMRVDLNYGSPNSRWKLYNYDCYCSYVEDLHKFDGGCIFQNSDMFG